jgi:2-C-methyl-D-erythritol 4-phosphate cytidylyltransferase
VSPGGVWAVIPAGGRGRRMGAKKQGLRLLGRPVLCWTVEAVEAAPAVAGIVVAVPAEDVAAWRAVLAGCPKLRAVVAGGEERQESVARGLAAVPAEAELVAVHDGVRPCVTAQLIERLVADARAHGAAVPALPVVETLKRAREGRVIETVDRDGLWAVQTPQVFRADLLREAHRRAAAAGVCLTDDAALVERLGVEVRLVPGEPGNVKITRPEDLVLAEAILRGRGAG